MQYIEAPNEIETRAKKLFLAGAITDAPDWQKIVVSKIDDLDIAVYNPRRANFPIDDPSAALEQITWEHKYLNAADMISFWFCKETIAPITLYECGTWTKTSKPIIIGMDPGYKRRQDVEIQTKLERPDVAIVYSLDDLVKGIYNIISQILFI
jgi:hypothetical protein